MIIRNRTITPRRGNELSAQGNALGIWAQKKTRPERAKAFALAARIRGYIPDTQGAALGY